jgi:hypothetical protein
MYCVPGIVIDRINPKSLEKNLPMDQSLLMTGKCSSIPYSGWYFSLL